MKDTKRIFTRKIIKYIRALLPWSQNKKISIIFDGPAKFHYFHLEPIIKEIVKDKRFNVTIIKWTEFTPDDEIPNVTYTTFTKYWHDWFNNYDILISTELERRPGWFVDGTSICMFHGAGAKMSYFRKPEMNDYDVIFSVGPMTYKVQKEFVNDSVTVEEIGLPVSDILIQDNKPKLPDGIKIDKSKQVLLYAPSWAYDPENVSMDENILNELTKIKNYNVILRPHPNLLKPTSCNGFDWNVIINKLKNQGVQISYSSDHSVYELLPYVDILMGDISSVTFEFLIFNRPIIIYMKDGVLDSYEAKEFTDPLLSSTTRLESTTDLLNILNTLSNGEDVYADDRKKLLNNMLFNIGNATNSAVKAINKYAFTDRDIKAKAK